MVLSYYTARMHRENLKNIYFPEKLGRTLYLVQYSNECNPALSENTGEKVRTVPLPPPQQKHEFTAAASHLSQSGSILKKRPYPLFFAELGKKSCNTNAAATHDGASDAATFGICFTR